MTATAEPDALATLKGFQRDTVAYVLRRLYDDPDHGHRFLVADEVGMGKTLVARGVIDGAINRLQHDDSVDRIDIIYICSNADIARQNLAKLMPAKKGQSLDTRITLLAKQVTDLAGADTRSGHKKVNLVSFTPGTSFDHGHSAGQVKERALLYLMLKPVICEGDRAAGRFDSALQRMLARDVKSWKTHVAWADGRDGSDPPDPDITGAFQEAIRNSSLHREVTQLVDELVGRRRLTLAQREIAAQLISKLRKALAQVSVNQLEPDLIILDEFQRFKHLLEEPDPGEREISSLAHELFSYTGAKVLLLSATPYRLFTFAEERGISGDDHYVDFLEIVRFLACPDGAEVRDDVAKAFGTFRQALLAGNGERDAMQRCADTLRRYMCRTERPSIGEADMLLDHDAAVPSPTAQDMAGYAALRRIADEVDGAMSVEYWKSSPYFLNFMDGYQLSRRIQSYVEDHGVAAVPASARRSAQRINRTRVDRRLPIDPGNARLRALEHDIFDQDTWRLLWLPPSLPYHRGEGPYAGLDKTQLTKRLIFSSWSAAPTAIASLVSHEASRRMLGPHVVGETQRRGRLNFESDDRPGGMTALALLIPQPTLAELTDPRQLRRTFTGAEQPTLDELVGRAEEQLAGRIRRAGDRSSDLSPDTWYWAAPFELIDTPNVARFPELTDLEVDMADHGESSAGLHAVLDRAQRVRNQPERLGSQPDDLHHWIALLGLASPGNTTWRALRRALHDSPGISAAGAFRAAAVIASGFRTLFNRPEAMALLDQEFRSDDTSYWQAVLQYCAAGNLQAVMDEYLHHALGQVSPDDDEKLLDLAHDIRDAIAFRVSTLRATDPFHPDSRPITFNARFAVRYGNAKGTVAKDEQSAARAEVVQRAFNSPFWPMVLASTSVGQEGVDFHWWCHSIVHWNVPPNPVDIEQREGRVHRFMGHAIRKNVATRYGDEVLTNDSTDPWRDLFERAAADRDPDALNQLGDLMPWWVFPGPSRIRRWTPSLPLSRDHDKARRLSELRGLYRLAFGQPRQEDLVNLLAASDHGGSDLAGLRIDLRPPPTRRPRARGDARRR